MGSAAHSVGEGSRFHKRVTTAPNKRGREIKGSKRIRRARAVLVAWCEGNLVFINYQTLVSASAEPEAVRILHLLEDWTYPSDLFSLLPEYSPKSIRAGIRQLLENTFLVIEGTPAAHRDADLASVWSDWLPHGSFHFATKDVEFLQPSQSARLFKRYLAESRQPPLLKNYGQASHIQLPRERPADSEFARVLFARKTHREYSRKPIPLPVISKLLYYTWGVTGTIDAPPFGQLFHKTSPSGGARHPGEVYLLAMRVDGLSQGLYHYDGVHHRLSRLRSLKAAKKAVQYAAGQEFVQNASALFVMTAVFPRVLWKYRFARAYRIVLLDAGHLCQTFCLVATWLGLAPFCTAAFEDTLIEKDLGLDGIRESALYLAGVGTPAAGKLRNSR
ncbi:MAG TPA: SagB family peptide dehydrogenase [Terriglobales bacterium]|nr:SagB family peptide dehydrogenase [Terriglobales bacterium]